MRMKNVLQLCVATALLWAAAFQTAGANPGDAAALLIADSSKASFSDILREDVKTVFENELKVKAVTEKDGLKIAALEKGELAKAAEGAQKVVVVEILPTTLGYEQMLICQRLNAQATLRVRVYDKNTAQYTFYEEISGKGDNKTFIPYTSIGTKPAVQEAVHNAAVAAAGKVAAELKK